VSVTRATVSRAAAVPRPVLGAVAIAWAVSVAAALSGAGAHFGHDELIEGGTPLAIAVLLSLVAWQVMVAAMMLPTTLPLIRTFELAAGRQPHPGRALAGLLGGYAAAWTVFGALAFGFDVCIHRAVDSSSWLRANEALILPTTLALAGAFQFSSLKEACLRQCRHPGAFVRRYYERGTAGAARLGARHGLFCVGCCWALMLVMFAVGVASLVWMAALTGVMVVEKTTPGGARSVPSTGWALLACAAALFVYALAAG
jgi:predicted metal-binding membrane protein